MTPVRSTPDAYIGLDAPSPEAWSEWHRAMLAERTLEDYRDPSTDWSDRVFRQFFLFMYDASFYDRSAQRWRAAELVDRWTAMFGRVDSVLLWHAYPRLGFDRRSQFDFYRDMPGGLDALRAQVSDVFHSRGVRVFVDYNPWADRNSGYDALGEIVAALDADGVMLDTMTDAPDRLEAAVLGRRPGVVFAPELRPRVSDLPRLRQSWAQWIDVGDDEQPTILKHRWLLPRHRQFCIRRWETSRRKDIVISFFNGAGLLLWDNVFGCWNPYSAEDRRLIAETSAILDHYADVFTHGEWLPLVPTKVHGLDANRWTLGDRSVITVRNRTSVILAYPMPEGAWTTFWGERNRGSVIVEPGGVEALVSGDASAVLTDFERRSRAAAAHVPDYEERTPRPRIRPGPRVGAGRERASGSAMVDLPAGPFPMKVRHERRECGCLPFGATDALMWGWFYKDVVEHVAAIDMRRFSMRKTAVTNAEFVAFVHAARYEPADESRFLAHLPREVDGSLPDVVPPELAELPVTFVSLPDARAFATWYGERLPSEAEWQWAAEGAGARHLYPWGDEPKTFPDRLRPAADPAFATATPQGIEGLSGNAWELTESEHTDGHTRFVMLRGGVFLPTGESEWLPPRGARPNTFHAKYILLADGLDRSETVSFRTVR